MRYRFQPSQHIREQSEFEAVFDSRNRFHEPNLLIFYKKSDLALSKIGFKISKRKLKRAVDRNKLKRVIRESFRLNQSRFKPCDLVFIAKFGVDKTSNDQIFKQLDNLWKKLEHLQEKA